MRGFCAVIVSALVLLGACIAEPYEPTSADEASLLDIDLELDGAVDERIWRHAPAGCEGRLFDDAVHRIARAEGAPDLAVVLDEDGDPVCVDTIESIAIELERLEGDPSPDPMYPKMLR